MFDQWWSLSCLNVGFSLSGYFDPEALEVWWECPQICQEIDRSIFQVPQVNSRLLRIGKKAPDCTTKYSEMPTSPRVQGLNGMMYRERIQNSWKKAAWNWATQMCEKWCNHHVQMTTLSQHMSFQPRSSNARKKKPVSKTAVISNQWWFFISPFHPLPLDPDNDQISRTLLVIKDRLNPAVCHLFLFFEKKPPIDYYDRFHHSSAERHQAPYKTEFLFAGLVNCFVISYIVVGEISQAVDDSVAVAGAAVT